jgi:hypothetical protein
MQNRELGERKDSKVFVEALDRTQPSTEQTMPPELRSLLVRHEDLFMC